MLDHHIKERFQNAFKTTLACFFGFALTDFFHLGSSQWTIITIIVVMAAQMYFGGMLKKAYLRFVGTLLGALIAGLSLLFIKDYEHNVLELITLLSVMGFSYFATVSTDIGQASTLGAVTVAIILLVPMPDMHIALFRTIEILLGITIAVFVTLFVFPIHAKDKLESCFANNFLILKEYYENVIRTSMAHCDEIEQKMMGCFLQCHKLLDEVNVEPRVDINKYAAILLHQKRLFRVISLLQYYLIREPHYQTYFEKENAIDIYHILEQLGKRMKTGVKNEITFPEGKLITMPHEEKYFFSYFILRELKFLIILTR